MQRGLALRDAAWHNTEPGQKGPFRDILNMSEYTGMVFGTVAALREELLQRQVDYTVTFAAKAAVNRRFGGALADDEPAPRPRRRPRRPHTPPEDPKHPKPKPAKPAKLDLIDE
eukprot:jgi/Tetstr1/426993/TSEL_017200.t1